MRKLFNLAAFCVALALPVSAMADQPVYAVRILGVKVGEMKLASQENANSYSVAASFNTTGLAGALSRVYFNVTAQGGKSGDRFVPSRYTEQMDTGERVENGALTWQGGLPRRDGERFEDSNQLPAAQVRGAVDPMTGLFIVARDRPAEALCNIDQKIYDGERLTKIVFTKRETRGDAVICSGRFQRLAGYSQDDLENNAIFPLTVTYRPAGDQMQMTEVRVKTIYGDATLNRR
ncbi:MAG: DUF3108 domain-containing protein [Rhodobacteraceae bacterium]|nr:DUF3108 domain-containing protein [Paracoccaceae bacterium]